MWNDSIPSNPINSFMSLQRIELVLMTIMDDNDHRRFKFNYEEASSVVSRFYSNELEKELDPIAELEANAPAKKKRQPKKKAAAKGKTSSKGRKKKNSDDEEDDDNDDEPEVISVDSDEEGETKSEKKSSSKEKKANSSSSRNADALIKALGLPAGPTM